jgi:hypothetical protein
MRFGCGPPFSYDFVSFWSTKKIKSDERHGEISLVIDGLQVIISTGEFPVFIEVLRYFP